MKNSAQTVTKFSYLTLYIVNIYFLTLTNQNIEYLLQQCKINNQRAQMEVYNRYYKAMFNTALRIVKDSFKAEDIMQESFLVAFSKLKSLKDYSVFGAWLKRIVINNSIQYYKQNAKYTEVPLDDVLYKVEDNEDTTENRDSKKQQANKVLNVMKTLKNNYQVGLTLHLIEGYDYEEISEIMDITYANCRTMISSKRQFKKKITTRCRIINYGK